MLCNVAFFDVTITTLVAYVHRTYSQPVLGVNRVVIRRHVVSNYPSAIRQQLTATDMDRCTTLEGMVDTLDYDDATRRAHY